MKNTLLVALLFMGFSAFAQQNDKNENAGNTQNETIVTTQHTVLMGETVILICKKYVVAPEDIYELNPKAVDGITPGMVLNIPTVEKITKKSAVTKPRDTSITSHRAKKANE